MAEREASSTRRGNVIESLDDSSWKSVFDASLAVVVLTHSSCPHCKNWVQKLDEFLRDSKDWDDVRFGKVVLDGPGVEQFKEVNEWLDHVEFVPFNIIIKDGQPVNSFPGEGVERLVKRLQRAKVDTSKSVDD